MRHLISTLQTHNQQMKGEVVKYKIRLRETQAELNQVGSWFRHRAKSFSLRLLYFGAEQRQFTALCPFAVTIKKV